ncbi:sterol desaturase family protein [Roseomonas frigidaquae]|uniref:Sterol desaturase family protein n=1 Tax=Falsiroseomonas frigidaquae TaxID=487318 RepID=A0ABX1EZ19_9PROT|nr:sterol desaturase family protein [Falsiroseomonas frigidaquae]NKE45345.1 sterol desaturase family protein [Falsiroseomonas frigidaquae]
MNAILSHEPLLRLLPFAGVFALMAVAEALYPRRPRQHPRWRRWPSNLGIVLLDTLVLRLVFPTAAVGVALAAEARGAGLLPWLGLSGPAAVVLAILLLDLVIYLQHRLFHAVPLLWRLHRMHHADLDFDVTTGLRFHPLEILGSMLIKLAAVVALGAPAVAVLLFEILLNATSLFNHANLRLPARLDRVLRRVLVTPDMHRVHHSVVPQETNSNFGFSLAIWDRLFGTYRAQPAAGHAGMTLGLEAFRDPRDLRLDRMLVQPLRGRSASFSGRASPAPPPG